MAGIYYEGKLQLNEYTAKAYMMTNTEDPADHNVALNRIKHFVYNELESTIFVNQDDLEACEKLSAADLNITTMPGDPVDQLIGIMLYTKFKAITEERLLIGEMELNSVLGDGVIYLHGDNENVEDVDPPDWWTSVDLVHCEQDLINSEKIVTLHKSSVWRDLDLQWPDIEDNTPDDDDETGNTVVFADFKKLDDKE